MAALCLLYGVFEMKKGTDTDLDSKTAKEILDVVQHESDLRREFERLAPNPYIGLVQFIILSVVFVVILLQDSPVAQDYPEVVWLIFIPFLFLLGLIGTESRRIHKRIEALAKIVENRKKW